MIHIKELKQALLAKDTLIWNDPDPIKNSDYTITSVEDLNQECFNNDEFSVDTPIFIQYGKGSEAQVYLHEIQKL